MSVALCCPARRQSSHYLPAEAPPCLCEVCPAAAGYALRQSLSVLAGCLSNGRLRQQWECTSVGAGCLGNGKLLSPTELHVLGSAVPPVNSPPGAFGITVLFVPLPWPKRRFPGISRPGSLSKSRSIRWICQSALSCLRLLVQQGTRTSALCTERCGALLRCSASRRLHLLLAELRWCPASLLYLGISPFCGQQDPSGNTALTHPPCVHRELQSWAVLTAPS